MRHSLKALLKRFSRPDSDERAGLADRLEKHVDMLAGIIGPRHVSNPTALHAAAAYIDHQLAETGYDVERQSYYAAGIKVDNLVVERPGTRRPGEIAILGAHYDTVPTTPGADDNASAVATLIEVARTLAPLRTRRTLRLVSFPCEEPPHFYTDSMGSQQYARRCRTRNERIVGMVCLEMVGYYSKRPNSQRIPPPIPRVFRPLFPGRGDFLAAVGNLRSLRLLVVFRRGFKRASRFPLFTIALPEAVSEIRLSDNSSFWDQGYPALMITDTSFLRNPHYHLPTDIPNTLDFDSLVDVTIGVAGAMAHLARAEA